MHSPLYVLMAGGARADGQNACTRKPGRLSPPMSRDELETLQESAADNVLRLREKIESAVDKGDVPTWVMEACTALEKASLLYGQTSERIKLRRQTLSPQVESPTIH
jgi:hypothetical protein